MKKIELVKRLGKYPLFTLNDFARITGGSPEYCRVSLYRLKREGLVFRVERGKYTAFDDPMVFASHIVVPSYISFWTALRFYNLTEQLPLDIMVASPKTRKNLEFRGTKIRFFKSRELWGYRKQRYGGFDIFVAEPEKAIVDSLLLRNTPFDEIAKAIFSKGVDEKRLAGYALRTGNGSLAKRLGCLMEAADLDASALAKDLDSNYVPLDWAMGKKGKRIGRWRVIKNRRLDDIG